MGRVYYLHPTRMRTEYQSPISALNITPLIDVMLVLLVMLIITLPMAEHQMDVPLPAPGPTTNHDPVVQKLLLTSDGVAHWNGEAMDDAALAQRLRETAIAGDDLLVQTEANARYERFNNMIALIKQSGVNRIGFVGNSEFAKWRS